jgi:PEP-CTERM motif
MSRHIMDRTQVRTGFTFFSILGLILAMPAWTEAGKISSSDSADALREVATASSLPISNSDLIDILHAGTQVSETTTTTYSDGTIQTAVLSIVPNTSAGTVTTTKDINLADGETEKVVDVATISGSTNRDVVTTTLPDGSIQTKDETEVTRGDATAIKGTVSMSSGGTQTITGQTVQNGSGSVTTLTITNPAGQVYHDRITIVQNGDLSQSETNTTLGPGGSTSTLKSTMSTVLNPSEVGQNDAPQYLTIPPTSSTTKGLNLEPQILVPPTGAIGAAPALLPIPLPEPSTLMFFGLVLGAAAVRHVRKCSRAR